MTFFIGIEVDLSPFCSQVKPPFIKEPVEKHHITLLYLGKTKIPRYLLRELSPYLLCFQQFKVVLKGAIPIPSLTKPRVIAAKITYGEEKIKELRIALIDFCNKHGIKISNKYLENFLPHATFARYRGKDYVYASKIAEKILKACEKISVTTTVKELIYYEAGDRYRKIAIFPLQGLEHV